MMLRRLLLRCLPSARSAIDDHGRRQCFRGKDHPQRPATAAFLECRHSPRPGAATPLLRPLRDAAYVHGESGMEGYDFVEHDRQPLAKPAFIALRDALISAPEPITLVAIGPLTNIALLLMHYPECNFNIRRLVIMGGSAGRGNFTPNAEFNIAVDPEAAARVFESGIEIVMCGLDVTNQAMLTPDYLASLPTLNRTGKMLHALFSHYRSGTMRTGVRMHDLCAIAWLVRPDLFTVKPCFVAVETRGDYTAGTTVVDIEGRMNRPANVQVALEINVAGFQQWVAEVLALAP